MADEQFFESPFDIRKAYETGFIGAYSDPDAQARLKDTIRAQGGVPEGAMACSQFGLEETGKDKLVLPVMEVLKLYPDCLPGGAQGRGDCVSWNARNGGLITMCCDITSNTPDEVTGRIEGPPDVSDEARLNGVLSTEAIYNWRRHGGDGWNSSEAVEVMIKDSGLWLRKKYGEIDVDFTRYSARNAGIYGSRTPPESWRKIGADHLVRTATELSSFEEVRDMLANGYGILTDGGESWSDQRDANGVSKRTRQGWAHAMALGAADDRPEIKQLYGEPLVLVLQSWGNWNEGPRTIFGTDLQIPVGAFWSKWSDFKRRYMVAVSGVNGWPRKKLTSYGALGNI